MALVMALDFVERFPQEPPELPGPELFRQFIERFRIDFTKPREPQAGMTHGPSAACREDKANRIPQIPLRHALRHVPGRVDMCAVQVP